MNANDTPPATLPDLLLAFDEDRRATFAAVADHLIPAAHGMPSAGDVVSDVRLRFVLGARPDLIEPLRAALRARRPGIAPLACRTPEPEAVRG